MFQPNKDVPLAFALSPHPVSSLLPIFRAVFELFPSQFRESRIVDCSCSIIEEKTKELSIGLMKGRSK